MKLHSTVENQAVLSNVNDLGEFRIRNSAKAFNILSSGLYANKIRAIIRELSCNAVDAHVAAGKGSVPFDVHLPNSLEPWFSIRDYGIGLNNEQVTNIYTTYFESTKTDSNDFIGALGLGSKSPFSYTDNFTVVAIKDGNKGVYTAFINEQGIPSIALMMSEETDEPNGVEVRFAVESNRDFYRFEEEAQYVYKFFNLRPVISGRADFEFEDFEYEFKDIIPGVHALKTKSGFYHYSSTSTSNSIAIMGNIGYPIEETSGLSAELGDLSALLSCKLVMEFDIGELDFQASREGLSYIPETVAAIKNKLLALNSVLEKQVNDEVSNIENLWERVELLTKRANSRFWLAPVTSYIANNDIPFDHYQTHGGIGRYFVKSDTTEVVEKYNIAIYGFVKSRHHTTMRSITPRPGTAWECTVSPDVSFVVNDAKTGAVERAKRHWRSLETSSATVFVLQAHDKEKPMLVEEFLASIHNPPASRIMKASELAGNTTTKSSTSGNASVVKLTERPYGYYDTKLVWQPAGTVASLSGSTNYYLPVSGYKSLGKVECMKTLHQILKRVDLLPGDIYGVRKQDLEQVTKLKNWVNLDTYIQKQLKELAKTSLMEMVKAAIDFDAVFHYNDTKFSTDIDARSPFRKMYDQFANVQVMDSSSSRSIKHLFNLYSVKLGKNQSTDKLIEKYNAEMQLVKERYPLLVGLRYNTDSSAIVEYINAIDTVKGM